MKHLLICSHHLHKDSISRALNTIKTKTSSLCRNKKKKWKEMNNGVRLSFICSRAGFYTLKQPLCMALPSRNLQMKEWLQDLATPIVFSKNQSRPQMSSAAIQQKSKQKQQSYVALLGHRLFSMYYATGISCLATRRDGFLHSDWQTDNLGLHLFSSS